MTHKISPEIPKKFVHAIAKFKQLKQNANIGDVESTARSLDRFGQMYPSIHSVDPDDTHVPFIVQAGNTRLAAARLLGWTHYSSMSGDHLSTEELEAFQLADNRTSELADTDEAALYDILSRVAEVPDLFAATGYDDDFLTDLTAKYGADSIDWGATTGDLDEIPDLPTRKPLSKLGDVWLLGSHRVVCGDALDAGTYPDAGTVHLICGDPPYFRKVDEGWDDQWGPAGFDGFLEFLSSTFSLWADACSDRAAAAVFSSPDFAWHLEGRFRNHFVPFNHVVWFKGHDMGGTIPVDEMRRWRPRSERLIIGEKGAAGIATQAAWTQKTGHVAAAEAYRDIRVLMCELRDEAGVKNVDVDKALGTAGMSGHYFGQSQWALPTEEAWATISELLAAGGVHPPDWQHLADMYEERRRVFDATRREFDADRHEFESTTFDALAEQRTDVWEIRAPRGDDRWGHAAAKPVALIAKVVQALSRPGDLVLDTFGGSGTTLIACEASGRPCHMIELDPAYVDVICTRWQRLTGRKPVLERTGRARNFDR